MKTVTIDELLSWAFVHELPKGGGVDGLDNANSAWRMIFASSWGKVTNFAELMTTVDVDRHDGGMWIDQGEPHDDAVAVGEAVASLAGFDAAIPAGWNPLPDWGAEAGDHARRAVEIAVSRFMARTPARRSAHLVALVTGTAILGREPGFEAPQPKLRMAMREGKPAWFRVVTVKDDLGLPSQREVDGYNPRAGRPHRGAYRKWELAEDPVGDIMGRLDRQLWAVALEWLARRLSTRLVGHRLASGAPEASPWPGGHLYEAVGMVERAAKIAA